MGRRGDTSDGKTAPATHAAFVRGINVGGKNAVPMAVLAELFEEAGCEGVRTYIASGNVVFAAPAGVAAMAGAKVTATIKRLLGFEPLVVVRSRADIERVLDGNPLWEDGADPKTVMVGFLEAPPKVRGELPPSKTPRDRAVAVGREVYVRYAGPMLESALTYVFLEKALGVRATFRNWRTVEKVAGLLGIGGR